jgi:hypothetical protein
VGRMQSFGMLKRVVGVRILKEFIDEENTINYSLDISLVSWEKG